MDRPTAGYEEDFYAWTRQQADALRRAGAARVNADLDWDNIAEEIETLGRSELRGVRSHVHTIIEHLLKLALLPDENPRSKWRRSVSNARIELAEDLTSALRADIGAELEQRYRHVAKRARHGLIDDGLLASEIPQVCPWTLDQLLDEEFWPENRHGLA